MPEPKTTAEMTEATRTGINPDEMREVVTGGVSTDAPFERVLRVDGKDVRLTLTEKDEIELLQKGMAADKRFQEAASKLKEAEAAIKFQQDWKSAMEEGDVDAFRRLGLQGGYSEQEVEAAVQDIWADGSEDGEYMEPQYNPSAPPQRSQQQGPRESVREMVRQQVGVSDLTPDMRRLMLGLEQDRQGKLIKNALDTSDIIRYNMAKYDEAGQDAIRKMVFDEVRGRLVEHGGDLDAGSPILTAAVQKVEAVLKALDSPRRGTGPLGMGPAPGGGDPGVYPTKKPEPVSSLDSRFDENIEDLIRFNLAKANQASE